MRAEDSPKRFAARSHKTIRLATIGNPTIHTVKRLIERCENFPTTHASPTSSAKPAHFSHTRKPRLNHHQPKNSRLRRAVEASPYMKPTKYGLSRAATTKESPQKMSRHRMGKRNRGRLRVVGADPGSGVCRSKVLDSFIGCWS